MPYQELMYITVDRVYVGFDFMGTVQHAISHKGDLFQDFLVEMERDQPVQQKAFVSGIKAQNNLEMFICLADLQERISLKNKV